jgi:hypothetical protein
MMVMTIRNDMAIFSFELGQNEFEVDGVCYSIVASDSTGPGPHDVIHTVKNLSNGNKNQMEMNSLIRIFKKSKLIKPPDPALP